MRVPKRRSEQNRKVETGPFYVTETGLEKLKQTQAWLEEQLPQLIADVEHTKSFGDFSENAAYQDAKHKLRRTHGRIAKLKDRIKRAVIIEQGENTSGRVQMGSKVTLDAKGKEIVFEILGAHEVDPSRGRISDQSPLGKALIGHAEGDVVDVDLAGGSAQYKIIRIH